MGRRYHRVFKCERWIFERKRLNKELGEVVNVSTVVKKMLLEYGTVCTDEVPSSMRISSLVEIKRYRGMRSYEMMVTKNSLQCVHRKPC